MFKEGKLAQAKKNQKPDDEVSKKTFKSSHTMKSSKKVLIYIYNDKILIFYDLFRLRKAVLQVKKITSLMRIKDLLNRNQMIREWKREIFLRIWNV